MNVDVWRVVKAIWRTQFWFVGEEEVYTEKLHVMFDFIDEYRKINKETLAANL